MDTNPMRSVNLFGTELSPLNLKTISTSTQFSTWTDSRIIFDTDQPIDPENPFIITLKFADNENGTKVEIFAFKDCVIRYFTANGVSSDFNMAEGTSVSFIYYNGWKHNGIYDAVWN